MACIQQQDRSCAAAAGAGGTLHSATGLLATFLAMGMQCGIGATVRSRRVDDWHTRPSISSGFVDLLALITSQVATVDACSPFDLAVEARYMKF